MPQSLFESCHLRSDITLGGIDDGQFAADLRSLLLPQHGEAQGVSGYANAKTYFSLTFPTIGLKKLLSTAADRMQRGNSNGLVVLSTSLGGGKTHSVMALYHLAKGHRPSDLADFVDPSTWPIAQISVAAVVGDMVDVLDGAMINGRRVHTLWGAMAAQLGDEAWVRLEQHDVTKTVPSTNTLLEVFGDQPAIVILDEMASYLRAAEKSGDQGAMNLAQSTPNFLKSLSEIATTSGRKVFFALTEATGDLFGDATESIRKIYSEVTASIGRTSTAQGTINPATGGEIAEILKRRLFSEIDSNAAVEVAKRYEQYYFNLSKTYPLIGGSKEAAEYANEISNSYPFHPALIRALDTGLSSSSKFQRTRGALKILGDTLAYFSSQDSRIDLLNTGDLHFSDNDGTLDHLTSQLDRKEFVAIAKADFVGSDSHAARIDQQRSTTLAVRFATAAFLFSLPIHDLGRSFEDLALNVLHDGEQPAQLLHLVDDALMRSCWYLQSQNGRYVFRTEPTINRVIDGALSAIKSYQIQAAETEYIEKVFGNRSVEGMSVVLGGADPAEVADTKTTTLVVFRPDLVSLDAGEGKLRQHIIDFRDSAGSKTRTYKNTLAYFAAGRSEQREGFESALKRSIALTELAASPPSGFPEVTLEKIRDQAASQQLAVALAFLRWFNQLYFFSVGTGDLIARTISLGEEDLAGHSRAKTERTPAKSVDESLVSTRLFAALRQELTNSKWRDAISVQDLNNLSLLGPGKKPTPLELYEYYLMDFRGPLPASPQAMLKGVQGLVSQGSYVAFDVRGGRFLSAAETTRVGITADFQLWDKSDVPLPKVKEPTSPPQGSVPKPISGDGGTRTDGNPKGLQSKPRLEKSKISPADAAAQILGRAEASNTSGFVVEISTSYTESVPTATAWTTIIAQTPKAFTYALISHEHKSESGALQLRWKAASSEEVKRTLGIIGEFAKLVGSEPGAKTSITCHFGISRSAVTGFVESIKLLESMGIASIDLAVGDIESQTTGGQG